MANERRAVVRLNHVHLNAIRLDKMLTFKAIADEAGCSIATVRRVFHSSGSVYMNVAMNLCRALDVNINDVLLDVLPVKDVSPVEPVLRQMTIFFCYSHNDEKYRKKLESHLSNLRRQNLIAGWHDRKIMAGSEWRDVIDEHLASSKVILLLVSSNFIDSDYCYGVEMKRALERHAAKDAHVIPIILRPCDWHNTPFGKLQALPTDGKPVTKWNTQDDAFYNIALGIRTVVESL
jgi:hypothetical protein